MSNKSHYGIHVTALAEVPKTNYVGAREQSCYKIMLGFEHGEMRLIGGGIELYSSLADNIRRELLEEGFPPLELHDMQWVIIVKQGNAYTIQRMNPEALSNDALGFYQSLDVCGIVSVVGIMSEVQGDGYIRTSPTCAMWFPDAYSPIIADHHVMNIEVLQRWARAGRPNYLIGTIWKKFVDDKGVDEVAG